MTNTIEKTWNLLNKTVDEVAKRDPEIKLNIESYEAYKQRFKEWYNIIKDEYMDAQVSYLDRHKVAGIIIVSILESDAIAYSKSIPKGMHFIGQYLVAASVGITYMQNRLNKTLQKIKKQPVDKIWMPEFVFSCDVPYFEIFGRNLYFAHTNKQCGLNPLDISKELFLLEYITVEKSEIDLNLLKEKKKK